MVGRLAWGYSKRQLPKKIHSVGLNTKPPGYKASFLTTLPCLTNDFFKKIICSSTVISGPLLCPVGLVTT